MFTPSQKWRLVNLLRAIRSKGAAPTGTSPWLMQQAQQLKLIEPHEKHLRVTAAGLTWLENNR
jgi:hypothetical protein